jgi:hypothetical protein
VRWDAVFADLEAQAEALEIAERAAEVQDRVRAEVGELTVVDRLRPAVGTVRRLRTVDGLVCAGTLARVGPDWVLLEQDGDRELLVCLAAVTGISGLGRQSAVPNSMDVVSSRLRLWFVLRRIARDRSPVSVRLADATALAATIDRVGADFVEVAVHPPGEARRVAAVRDVLVVPMTALVSVRRSAN